MSNPLLLFTAQIVAIMSVFLLAVGYLKSDPKSASARIFAVIALFVVFYLLNGMSGDSIDPDFRINLSAIDRLIELGTSSVSGLFMIYCFLIFQEQQEFPASGVWLSGYRLHWNCCFHSCAPLKIQWSKPTCLS